MGHITVSATIAAPVELVFGYVDDHKNTTKYMKDLVKWEPVGSQVHGKGAHFAVAMKAGPATLDSSVEINEWAENQTIGWVSTKGLKQTGKWSFKAAGSGKTAATFDMEYDFPGGIAGRLVGKAAEPIMRGNIQRSVEQLKEQTERLVGKGAKGAKGATA